MPSNQAVDREVLRLRLYLEDITHLKSIDLAIGTASLALGGVPHPDGGPTNDSTREAVAHRRGGRCVLCGEEPMPVAGEFPDGCRAHPGCMTDPVFGAELHHHGRGVGPGPFAMPSSHDG